MASFYPYLYEAALALCIDARIKAGLTQAQLAERFGQTERFVASYESGDRLLDPAEYIAICRTIGVEPYELLQKAEKEWRWTARSERQTWPQAESEAGNSVWRRLFTSFVRRFGRHMRLRLHEPSRPLRQDFIDDRFRLLRMLRSRCEDEGRMRSREGPDGCSGQYFREVVGDSG